jgi:hypothetical protein
MNPWTSAKSLLCLESFLLLVLYFTLPALPGLADEELAAVDSGGHVSPRTGQGRHQCDALDQLRLSWCCTFIRAPFENRKKHDGYPWNTVCPPDIPTLNV